ncbi:MAG: hypothetical protein ACTSPQ_16440 [Candidatus Helarchaeota archaeon]
MSDAAGNTATVSSGSYTIQDNYCPEILDLELPDPNPTPDEDVLIRLKVNDSGSGIKNISLWISIDHSDWVCLSLILNDSNIWEIEIPRQPDNTEIQYYFIIYDNSGNSMRNPINGYYILHFESAVQLNNYWIMEVIIGILSIIAVELFLAYILNKIKIKELNKEIKEEKASKRSMM